MLSGSSSLLSLHVGDQVDDPAGVAELVVVPGHHLQEVVRQLDPCIF